MTTWIALLRGINVGGHNKLPMKRLRELLSALGFQDVATYIQSGNCAFRSDMADPTTIGKRIADAIEAEFDFRPSIFVLTQDDVERAIAANPFADGTDDAKLVHLLFLSDAVDSIDESAMRALAAPGDDFALAGRVFYLMTPAGIGRSKLAERLDKFLPVDMTARNLRSANKIAELGRSLGQ